MATPTSLPATFTSGQVLTAAQMNNLRGAFRILQVVSTTKTDAFSTAAAGATITGLTATITPSSTSSKILASYVISASHDSTGVNGLFGIFQRSIGGGGATDIFVGTSGSVANRSNVLRRWDDDENVYNLCGEILDTPATTSAITYSYSIGTIGGGTAYVNRQGSATTYGLASTITVMEVSA